MAPCKRQVKAKRNLICSSCDSWIDFAKSGCANSWVEVQADESRGGETKESRGGENEESRGSENENRGGENKESSGNVREKAGKKKKDGKRKNVQ